MRSRKHAIILPFLLFFVLWTTSLNSWIGYAASAATIDPLTGDRYEDAPPAELLSNMSQEEVHDALRTWVGLDDSLKERARAYYTCKENLDRLKNNLETANNDRTVKLAERIKLAKTLKKMLVAALGRLGIQTAVIVADGTTDLQLALGRLKETSTRNINDIKNARKYSEMMSEWERLARKAVEGRRLLLQAEEQLTNVMRQIELAKLRKGITVPDVESNLVSEKGFKLKPMERGYIRNDGLMEVKYFSSVEREQYRLTVKDGKLYDAKGKLFDTSDAANGRAIFIIDGEGRIYYYKDPEIMVIHHSSLNFGAPVANAGELGALRGRLNYLSNRSGHYLPNLEHMRQTENYLKMRGIDMKGVEVEYMPRINR